MINLHLLVIPKHLRRRSRSKIGKIIIASVPFLNLLAFACMPIMPDETVQPTFNQATEPTVLSLNSSGIQETTPTESGVDEGEDRSAENLGKWKRFEVSYENTSWEGNPFDLDLTAIFTHIPSGRTLKQLGFYAGGDIWKIYFMPDELGEWTFITSSSDPDLDDKSGFLTCVASDLPGRLIADGNRWKLEDTGGHVAPVLLPTREWFKRTNTDDGIDDFILWVKNTTGAFVIGTTLVYFTHAQEEVPYIKGEEGTTFNIEMWDRLNSHYDMLRDQGMGFYIMFYSDDEDSPERGNIQPQSSEDLRLFRYAVARFSAYPIVMWDTGIDISEYRNDAWIDWFSEWFNENDPWQHPVSSRSGGGSGGKLPASATYFSDGASTLPEHGKVVQDWSNRAVPTAYTDRWRENYERGEFTREKIRRAAWEVGLVGGSALYVGGNESNGYLDNTYATDLEAAPDLGVRNYFLHEQVLDLSKLAPHDELLDSGTQVILSANPMKEIVVYDYDGGSFTIDLSGIIGTLSASWFDPRTGINHPAGLVEGGGVAEFTTPDSQDWVLHLTANL